MHKTTRLLAVSIYHVELDPPPDPLVPPVLVLPNKGMNAPCVVGVVGVWADAMTAGMASVAANIGKDLITDSG